MYRDDGWAIGVCLAPAVRQDSSQFTGVISWFQEILVGLRKVAQDGKGTTSSEAYSTIEYIAAEERDN